MLFRSHTGQRPTRVRVLADLRLRLLKHLDEHELELASDPYGSEYVATRPSIVTQQPGNGATGVPPTSVITLFASEPLNAATIPGAVRVSENGILITGTVQVTGSGQAIEFIPSGPVTRSRINAANRVLLNRRSSATRNRTMAALE